MSEGSQAEDKIRVLTAQLAMALEALRPFAKEAPSWDWQKGRPTSGLNPDTGKIETFDSDETAVRLDTVVAVRAKGLCIGDFRRAAEVAAWLERSQS